MVKRFIPLSDLKEIHQKHKLTGGPLGKYVALVTRARLSVQPLTKDEYDFIVSLEDKITIIKGHFINSRDSGNWYHQPTSGQPPSRPKPSSSGRPLNLLPVTIHCPLY
jgi:hypothetical protein